LRISEVFIYNKFLKKEEVYNKFLKKEKKNKFLNIKKKKIIKFFKNSYQLAKFLSIVFFKDISSILVKKNKQIHVFLKNTCFDIIFFLKNNVFFLINQLLDFTIVDRLEMAIKKNKRFEFVYVFLSTVFNYRIFIRGYISIFESLRSLSNLYNSAN